MNPVIYKAYIVYFVTQWLFFILIIILRTSRSNMALILEPSLSFASIAFLSEGKIEVVAHNTYPITIFGLRKCFVGFGDWLFAGSCKEAHLN